MAAGRKSGARSGVAFLLVGVLIAALLFGADRLALMVVENQVSHRLQTELGTSTAPKVGIEGFPFLTQVLRDRLSSVHVVADDVTAGGQGAAELAHVDLRMHEVRSADRFQTFTAGQVDGTATLDYPTAQSLTGLDLVYAREDRVEVTVKTTLLSVPVTAQVVGRPVVDVADQTLTLDDVEMTVAGVQVPLSTSQALLSTLLKPIPISGVPFGLSISDVVPQLDGLDATITGQQITFSR